MQRIYDPFVMRRFAEGRIIFVNSQMPFEFFVNCFTDEKPFFIVSQLFDGRIAITPNTMFIPQNFQTLLQGGHAPQQLLPNEFEYVTMKDSTYPLIITAHPVARVDEWLRNFERWVKPWAQQTLEGFVAGYTSEFTPLFEDKKEKFPVKEPVIQ
ncbi:MAG: hypothetical protein ACYTGR_08605 [Planctomycetota bacterium]|jgi:hypothetical protein